MILHIEIDFTLQTQGKFDAFKFADDVVVRFQVNVQFCLQECLPIQCDNSRHADSDALKTTSSWGKRRKRRNAINQHHQNNNQNGNLVLTNQTELHREIIVEGMKNKKEAQKNVNHVRGVCVCLCLCIINIIEQLTTNQVTFLILLFACLCWGIIDDNVAELFCTSKVTLIIGFITMVMLEVTKWPISS